MPPFAETKPLFIIRDTIMFEYQCLLVDSTLHKTYLGVQYIINTI